MQNITWIQRALVAALTAVVYLVIGCDAPSAVSNSVASLSLESMRGPEGPTGPQGAAGPQGPEGPAGVAGKDGEAADTVNRGGSRLRARYLTTDDGARQLTGFYDEELEERCTFARGADEYAPGEAAVMRCYPVDAQRIGSPSPNAYTAFADPDCKIRVVSIASSGSNGDQAYDGQRYAMNRGGLPSWDAIGWESARVVRVYEVAPWTDDAPAYRPICGGGVCSGCAVFNPTPEEQAQGYKLAPGPWVAYWPIAPDTFVEGVEAHD